MYIIPKDITTVIKTELVSRIVASIFVKLQNTIHLVPSMDSIRKAASTAIYDVDMTPGTSFACMCEQIVSNWNGGVDFSTNIENNISKNAYLGCQYKELVDVLAPIVIQTIRLLDVYQHQASELLFSIQDDITQRISSDFMQANVDIVKMSLGVLDDAEALDHVAMLVDTAVPDPDSAYNAASFHAFAKRDHPYAALTQDDKAELSKWVLDEDDIPKWIIHDLTEDPIDRLLPVTYPSFKPFLDELTMTWSVVTKMKQLFDELMTEADIKYSDAIKNNIEALLYRVAFAIYVFKYKTEVKYQDYVIYTHDGNTVYVYPWYVTALSKRGVKDVDQCISDFVKAKIIDQKPWPVDGWLASVIAGNQTDSAATIRRYVEASVGKTKLSTRNEIVTVCIEKLPMLTSNERQLIAEELIKGSPNTLQILLEIMIKRCNDFYLSSLYEATKVQFDNSTTADELQQQTLIQFLLEIANKKIIHPA